MKKLFSLLTFIMLCLYSIGAENPTMLTEAYQVYVTARAKGRTGKTTTLKVNLKNLHSSINQFTADIFLPEGVTLVEGSAEIIPNRMPEGFNPVFTAEANADGSVAVSLSGKEGLGIPPTDGAVASFQVAVASDVTPGKYVVTVKNALIIEPGEDPIPHIYNSNEFIWTIEGTAEYYNATFLLDANGEQYDQQKLSLGDTISVPNAPEREGYTFIGWNPAIPETMFTLFVKQSLMAFFCSSE